MGFGKEGFCLCRLDDSREGLFRSKKRYYDFSSSKEKETGSLKRNSRRVFIIKNKKSQASMEFLMTYGWAILVVLVALGAFFYSGFFNTPVDLLPEECNLPVLLKCVDQQVSVDSITLVLQNIAGEDIIVKGINASSDALKGICTFSNDITIRNGESKIFTLNQGDCDFEDKGKKRNRYNLKVIYSWSAVPSVTSVLTGELTAGN